MGIHPLALAEIHRFQGFEVNGRFGEKHEVLAVFRVGDAGMDHLGGRDARSHDQIQRVDLVEGVEACVLGGIAGVVGIVEPGKTVVSSRKVEHPDHRPVQRKAGCGSKVLDGDEVRPFVDDKLNMIRSRFVHREVLEDLHDLTFVADHQVESAARIERTVFDLDGETLAPGSFVGRPHLERVHRVHASGQVCRGRGLDDARVLRVRRDQRGGLRRTDDRGDHLVRCGYRITRAVGRQVHGDCLSQDLDGEWRIVSRNDEFDGDGVSRGPRLNRPPRDSIRADGAGCE